MVNQTPILLQQIETKYHIAVVVLNQPLKWHGDDYWVTADPPSQEQIDLYAKRFSAEWNRYPADVGRKFRIKKIVFGIHLAVDGQIRGAVPAADGDAMYYDPELGYSSGNFQVSVIHHELFHLIEDRGSTLWKDPEWSALNLVNFRYGEGGAKMRDPGVGNLNIALPGFVTLYSTAGVEEDKAELYAHAAVDPDFVRAKCAFDPVLARKFDLLRKRMRQMGLGNLLLRARR